jgi:hypothetical protein
MPLDVSLTIDRAGLSLPDLVITNDGFATGEGLWVADFSEAVFEFRYGYAPASPHVAGQQLLWAVLEQGGQPVTVYARGTSSADLAAKKATVEQAVSQFNYDLTVTVDGVSQTFSADPTWPQWAADSGMSEAFMASTSLAFRVNRVGV